MGAHVSMPLLRLLTFLYRATQVRLLAMGLICWSQIVHGRAGIELMPIAVWQGKPTRPWSLGILRDIRKKYPHLKMAHAISPAPLVRGGDGSLEFRMPFSRLIQPGDDILLHVAPWKSLVEKAQINFRREPTVFGMPVHLDDCANDCGLELSTKAFSPAELKAIVTLSEGVLRASGFGDVNAVFFDEGMIESSRRRALLGQMMTEDWSGVELSQLRRNMQGFPVYAWNVENAASFRMDDMSRAVEDGVKLDHLRFGIQAEISDMESAARLIEDGLSTAQEQGRLVRIPIVFNVEELIHTQSFLEGAIEKALRAAAEKSVPVREWKARNSTWNADAIRQGKVADALLVTRSDQGSEAEFVSDDERLLTIEMAH